MNKDKLDYDCVFCQKILFGSAVPWNTSSYIFEPLNPVTPGHMLVIPPWHIEKETPGSDRYMGVIFEDTMNYAKGRGEDFNLIINAGTDATQTIKHLHVHYVPRRPQDGLTLPWTGQEKDHIPKGAEPVRAATIVEPVSEYHRWWERSVRLPDDFDPDHNAHAARIDHELYKREQKLRRAQGGPLSGLIDALESVVEIGENYISKQEKKKEEGKNGD